MAAQAVVAHRHLKAKKASQRRMLAHKEAQREKEKLEHSELFTKYDVNKDGFLGSDELQYFLKQFNGGELPSEEEVAFITAAAKGRETPRGLSQHEMVLAMVTWRVYQHDSDFIDQVVAKYDSDRDGVIGAAELKGMITAEDAIRRSREVPLEKVPRQFFWGGCLLPPTPVPDPPRGSSGSSRGLRLVRSDPGSPEGLFCTVLLLLQTCHRPRSVLYPPSDPND